MTDQYRPKPERTYGPIRDPIFVGTATMPSGLTLSGKELRIDVSDGAVQPFAVGGGLSITALLDNVGTLVGGSANENALLVSTIVPATGAPAGYQKNSVGVYMLVREGISGGIEHDTVAIDAQIWVDDGVANANAWLHHWQGSVGFTAGSASGTMVIAETQLINMAAGDDGRIDSGTANHQIGFNVSTGAPGVSGVQNATAAFVVSATNNDASGGTKPYWHQAYFAATRAANGGAAIGNGDMDTAFELQDMFGVFMGGHTSIGKTTRIDVNDLLEVQSILTNGLAQRWDRYGHQFTAAQATAPTQALGTGAAGGTGSVNTGIGAGSTDQAGLIQFTTGTAPVAGGAIVTVSFANAFPVAPKHISLEGRTAIACADRAKYYVSGITVGGFTVSSPSSAALTTSQGYQISWKVE